MIDGYGGSELALPHELGDSNALRTEAEGEADIPATPDGAAGGRRLREHSTFGNVGAVVLAFDLDVQSELLRKLVSFARSLAVKVRYTDFASMDRQLHRDERRNERHDQKHQRHPDDAECVTHCGDYNLQLFQGGWSLKFVAGIVVGFILVFLGAYFYFATGMAPVATADPTMPFEKMFANKALHARIDKEMPKSVPIPADEATFIAGAQTYSQNCAVCHGLPGQEQSAIAKGMFPKPPHFFRGKGVTDDEPGETYWKVDNGIRLTGMPAFNKTLSETQMWQVSLLLANATKISDAVKQQLQPPPLPGALQQGGPASKGH